MQSEDTTARETITTIIKQEDQSKTMTEVKNNKKCHKTMTRSIIECGFCSYIGDSTAFTNAPFNPFIDAQQYVKIVGSMITFSQGHTLQNMLRLEAEPGAPMPTDKKRATEQSAWARGKPNKMQQI